MGNQTSKIEAILFDLDGTLTDPKIGITRCIQHALNRLGEPSIHSDQLTWCIGPPLISSFVTLLNNEQKAEKALSIYRERYNKKGLYENELYPDIKNILTELCSNNFDLYLATSKPEVYARKILDHFGLQEFFKGIHGSELDGKNSDKTELLSHILKVHNLKPAATLMVGDRKYDIIGANNNEINVLGVLYGYGDKQELSDADCKNFANSPKDIPHMIRKVFMH